MSKVVIWTCPRCEAVLHEKQNRLHCRNCDVWYRKPRKKLT